MKVGIPRALLYFKYRDMWINFFRKLEIDIVISPQTNREILNNGLKYSIDESCLSSKVFMGHVEYLRDKCDLIFIPRVAKTGKKQELCVKFFGLSDIVNNTFSEVKILDYNHDVDKRQSEMKAYLDLGLKLGKSPMQILKAYTYAFKCKLEKDKKRLDKQNELLLFDDKLKVLIVSHSYNTYDEYIGGPVVNYLKELNVTPIFADIVDKKLANKEANNISEKIYWAYNRELLGGIEVYKDRVDGIILITTFPCGPDSLANEMITKRVKNKPIITIILDEQDGSAGMITRIESFIDILQIRKARKIVK
ncbi:MAG: acyl-CoA dehydratase activase-related protein [Clostridia bacterium]|nr:acyl-CoA dehydratase activase-related protein [Clostridia bacterium]MDD4387272.1 acyl-CoA dehydratase activase-related protein [Clostridia bacterium]